MSKATAQITIMDYSDAIISNTMPTKYDKNTLWLDTSKTPPVLKLWNGFAWVVVNDYSKDIININNQIKDNNNKVKEQIKTIKETESNNSVDIQKLKDRIITTISHDDLEKTTKKLGDKILSISSETNKNKHLIEETSKSTKDEITGINQKINTDLATKKQINELSNKNVTIEKTLDGITKEVSSVKELTNTNLTNVNKEIQNNSNKIEQTNNSLSANINSLNSKINNDLATKKEVSSVDNKVVNLNASINGIGAKLETTKANTDKQINDIDKKLDTSNSEINILKDKVQSVVETTNAKEIEKLVDGKVSNIDKKVQINSNKIEQSSTSINAQIKGINNTISTDLATKQEVSQFNNRLVSLTANLDNVGAKIEHTTSTIKDMKIGGANLIKNSGNFINFDYWVNIGCKIYSDKRIYIKASDIVKDTFIKQPLFLKPNTTYTLSIDYDCGKGGTSANDRWHGVILDTSNQLMANIIFNNGNHRDCKTFTTNSNINYNLFIGGFNLRIGTVIVKNIMLQEGNKATEWQPSPEDTENKVATVQKEVAEVNMSVNQINAKVSNGRGLISTINLTPSDATINASKINLKGYATFSSLSTAGQTTIDGRNLKAGTITSDKIYAKTIDGIKITGSEFKGGCIDTQNLKAHGEVYFYHDASLSGDLTVNRRKNGTGGGLLIHGAAQIDGGLTCNCISKHNQYQSILVKDQTVFQKPILTDDRIEVGKYLKVGTSLNVRGQASVGQLVAHAPNAKTSHLINGNCSFSKDVHVNGGFWVDGAKHRLVKTESYGKLGMNAIESANCIFEDDGRAKTINKKCRVPLSNIYLETIEGDYDVMLSVYGLSDLRVINRQPTYFDVVVKDGDDCEFYYIVRARQKGYKKDRLQKFEESDINGTTK